MHKMLENVNTSSLDVHAVIIIDNFRFYAQNQWQWCFFLSILAKDQIYNDLKTRNAPVPAVTLQRVKAPVPDIVCSSLTDKKAAIELVWHYLNILQQQAK